MTKPTSDVKDGFDLIEYPSVFPFKAMCRSSSGDARQIVKQIVLLHVADKQIKSIEEISSRTGKFKSVTISVELFERETLEAIYQELAASKLVVMTL